MDHKLSVLVQVGLDGRTVRVIATGCLTELSQRGLSPLIRRARALTPGIRVTVDLSGAQHVEAAGVELLRRAVDHDDPVAHAGPVELVVPAPSGHPVLGASVPPARAAGASVDRSAA